MPEHEVTFAKFNDWKAECVYSIRNYSEAETHVVYYSIKRISEEQLEEIKNVATERVQAILSKYI